IGNGEVIISKVQDKGFSFPEKPTDMQDELFSERFACPNCGTSVAAVEPRLFSFNSPFGACPSCNGLGLIHTIDEDLVFAPEINIAEGGILPFSDIISKDTWFARTVRQAFKENDISLYIPLKDMPEEKKKIILDGTGSRVYEVAGTNRFGEKTTIYESY